MAPKKKAPTLGQPATKKSKKASDDGLTEDYKRLAQESDVLRAEARANGIYSGFKPTSDTISPNNVIMGCDGADIIKKKSSGKRNKFLVILPGRLGCLNKAAGSIGRITRMDTPCPLMYLSFPNGELKLEGSFVYPRNRYLRLNLTKDVIAEEVFDVLLVFSRAYWIGDRDSNPDEDPLPFPDHDNVSALQKNIPFSSSNVGVCSEHFGVSSNSTTTRRSMKNNKPSHKKVVEAMEEDESEDDIVILESSESEVPSPPKRVARKKAAVKDFSESSDEEPSPLKRVARKKAAVKDFSESSDEEPSPPKRVARKKAAVKDFSESSDEEPSPPKRVAGKKAAVKDFSESSDEEPSPPKRVARKKAAVKDFSESSDEEPSPPKRVARKKAAVQDFSESSDEEPSPPKRVARKKAAVKDFSESSDEEPSPPKRVARKKAAVKDFSESSDDIPTPPRKAKPTKKATKQSNRKPESEVELISSSSEDEGVPNTAMALLQKIKSQAASKSKAAKYTQPKLSFPKKTVNSESDSV
ncbi:hypothetical protein P9112_007064 [Eukaryota sp. TZLM1-RC]